MTSCLSPLSRMIAGTVVSYRAAIPAIVSSRFTTCVATRRRDDP